MYRTIGVISFGLLAAGFTMVGGRWSVAAEDSFQFATRQVAADEAASSTQAVPVQRRVRMWGRPIPPGPPPGPAFGPPVPPVPPVPFGPTHVRVRVPFFSGDFYVNGGPPVVVDEPAGNEEPPSEFQAPSVPPLDQGTSSQQSTQQRMTPVAHSSNPHYRELVDAYSELQVQLEGLTTAGKWQNYLQLPLEPAPVEAVLDSLSTDEGRGRLAKCLARYDRVGSDPAFAVVADLPAFERTRLALYELTGWLDQQPTVAAPDNPLPPPEEIPLPE